MLCSNKKCLNSSGVTAFYQALLPGSILPLLGTQVTNLHCSLQHLNHHHAWQAEEGECQLCSAQCLSVYHQTLDHHSQVPFTLLAPVLGGLSTTTCLLNKVSLISSFQLCPFSSCSPEISSSQVHSIQQ